VAFVWVGGRSAGEKKKKVIYGAPRPIRLVPGATLTQDREWIALDAPGAGGTRWTAELTLEGISLDDPQLRVQIGGTEYTILDTALDAGIGWKLHNDNLGRLQGYFRQHGFDRAWKLADRCFHEAGTPEPQSAYSFAAGAVDWRLSGHRGALAGRYIQKLWMSDWAQKSVSLNFHGA